MMFAAVDLGSNSFRLHIGSHDGSVIRIVKSARDPIRFGAGLDEQGYLTESAMQTALGSLARFRQILSAYSLQAVRVVATNTLRVAKNASAFLSTAEDVIGYPIEVISGEEEGRLIYMGVASALPPVNERRLVIDIGGGSTELVLGWGKEIELSESFSVGTVRQSMSFFPGGQINAASFEAAILSSRSYFEDGAGPFQSGAPMSVYGSSGTIRAISEAIARNALGDGSFSYASIEALKDRLIASGHFHDVSMSGIKPERVPALAGGLAILIAIMRELDVKAMTAVDAGLRMGVIADLHLRATQRDRRDQAVREFMTRFHVDQGRASRVAHDACSLYAQLQPAVTGREKLLHWSGLLHEVGLAVSHTGYHKHGSYMVANADLPGHTSRDQRAMSILLLAQKGNLRKVADFLADPDFAKAVLALRLAVVFMHSRAAVDMSDLRLKMTNRIEFEVPRSWAKEHPSASYWIAKEAKFWQEVGIGFTVRAK